MLGAALLKAGHKSKGCIMGEKKNDIIINTCIATGVVIIVIMIMCLVASLMKKGDNTTVDTGNTNGTEQSAETVPDSDANSTETTPKPTESTKPTIEPTVEPEATAEPTPEPTEEPAQEPSKSDITICIDAAHQKKGDNTKEPIGPGASEERVKVTYGATGVSSNVTEGELTLTVSLKLKDALIAAGYKVYMIREESDVNISDSDRAKLANQNADLVLHIHANASETESTSGVMAFVISEDNPYAAGIAEECQKLGSTVTANIAKLTGQKDHGARFLDKLGELNFSTITSARIEIGYLSNAEEDKKLQTAEFQDKIVQGIVNGVNEYLGR